MKPNLRDMAVFDGKSLNTNSKGVRGQTEYQYQRLPKKRRIVTLGDSYTFGDEVPDDETYSYYLEHLLPNTDVLNLGVSGYGHDQMLLYLKEEGIKYRPDVVLIGFVWFDIFRNIAEFTSYSKPKFELQGSKLHLTNVPVPPPQSILDAEIYRSKALDVASIFFERVRWLLGLNRERAERLTLPIFDDLVDTARQNGAVAVFVYLPVLDEILNTVPAMDPNERFLFRYCEMRKVPCLFLRERFLTDQRDGIQLYARGHHWFANGHMSAARGIKDFLQNMSFFEQASNSDR